MPTHELIQREGGEATFVGADTSNFAQMSAVVQAAIDAYGRLDVLVNNAVMRLGHFR